MLKAVGLLIVVACQRTEPTSPVVQTLPMAKAGAPMPDAKVIFVGSDGGYEIADQLRGPRTPVTRAESLDDALDPPPPPEDDAALEKDWNGTFVTLEEKPRDPEDQARSSEHYLGEVAHVISRPLASFEQPVIVVARPDAPASAVIAALEHVPGLLAVDTSHGPGVLAIGFRHEHAIPKRADKAWVEQLRTGFVGDATPRAGTRLDVIADAAMTAQELVTAIEDARTAGWEDVGLGASTADVARRREEIRIARGPAFSVGQPTTQGELAKKDIRAVVKRHEAELLTCFPAGADATLTIHFTIKPDGTVSDAAQVGERSAISDCATLAFIKMVFPKPASGVVEVNYPLFFHQGD